MREFTQIIFKIMIILIIFILIQHIFTPIISNASTWDNIIQQGDAFVDTGKEKSSEKINDNDETWEEKQPAIQEIHQQIYRILFVAAIIAAVIIGAILGIKFITESVEGQAKVKEMLLPYIAGCIVAFGSFGIWKLVITILSQI